jgi:hypothetical protein
MTFRDWLASPYCDAPGRPEVLKGNRYHGTFTRLLTIDKAAAVLGCTVLELYRWMENFRFFLDDGGRDGPLFSEKQILDIREALDADAN